MRSSEGRYYPSLDHVRAIAALMVYYWHLVHSWVPTDYVPEFFALSIFEEGHTGVSLFMVLSGYLFSKLLGNRSLFYTKFLWNRFVRLVPLLSIVFLYLILFRDFSLQNVFSGLFYSKDWIFATWTLSVEFHFYLIFPFLILILRRYGTFTLISTLCLSIGIRFIIWKFEGQVHELSYWTIVGRFDQFLLGMVFFKISEQAYFQRHSRKVLPIAIVTFAVLWHEFNKLGGFYHFPEFPSTSPIWIGITTLEGIFYGCIIAAYDRANFDFNSIASRALAKLGEISYSFYLWHLIIIFEIVRPAVSNFFDHAPSDPLTASLIALAFFPLFFAVANLSYKYIEQPFFRHRSPYMGKSGIELTPSN